MEAVLRDFRHALRALRRTPGFTVVAIVTLALGVGANATVFSVLDALLLRPLPVANAERLFFLETTDGRISESIPTYRDLRTQNTTLADLAAYRITPMALQRESGSERVWGYLASGNYFDLLGVRPAAGRFFTPSEDIKPGAAPVAVISYDGWQRRFGGSAAIVGTAIRINGLSYTILGVAPRGFHGTEVFYRPDIWIPMSMEPLVESRNWLDARNTQNAFLIGRLRQDTTVPQATSDLNAIATRLADAYPDALRGVQYQLVRPGLFGSIGRAPLSAFVIGVMVLSGLVLLAACANLGSLLSSRLVDRFRDIAIRLAIGASRASVVRHVFVEIGILAAAGGAAGYIIASLLLAALSRWRLPLLLPVQLDVTPDLSVVAFGAMATIATAVLAGLAPARHAWRTDPARLVVAASAPWGFGWRVRDVLLGVQVAICCVVICASIVSVRSLAAALNVPIGFETKGVTAVSLDLSAARYTPQEGLAFQRRALDAVGALPGVTSVAFTSALPLTLDRSTTTVFPSDVDPSYTKPVEALVYAVTPTILDVLQMRLVSGRAFTENDRFQTEPVAIVNRTFSRRVLLTDDAINMRFRTLGGRIVRVVGIVEDGKYGALVESPQPVMFRPVLQSFEASMVLLVRASRQDASLARAIERLVAGLDPRVPLVSQGSLANAIAVAFLPAQAASIGITSFGALAVVLALVGIYGLAAYSISARVREIGIRVAIGAQPSQALRFALGRTALLLGLGAVCGMLVSAAMAPLLGAVMFHASSRDPIVLATVGLVMVAIGVGAAWIPARRALSLDPARALRET